MSTKKEKCCECTSKERPSHVFRSSGTPGMKDGGYFTCNCPCHQTESIEWEKDLSFRFDTWLKLYPGTPTIGEIEEWWLESLRISITTAVEARERVDENTSDGYHTFKELYEFRKVYNAVLFNEWAKQGKYNVHKSLSDDSCFSTKKEKCNGTKAEWLLECENMVKDNSFVTPSSHLNVLAIQDLISKAITTALAKRELEIADEVNKLLPKDWAEKADKAKKEGDMYTGGFFMGMIDTVEKVLSILKH